MDVLDDMILNTDVVENAVIVAEQRGELRGEVKAIQTLWHKKFGEITADVEAVIASASGEMLERLIAQMVDPAFTLTQARIQLGL